MARRIPILSVTQSGGRLGSFVVGPTHGDNPSGDWTPIFKGKFYRDADGNVRSFFGPDGNPREVPGGSYQLVEATTFRVVANPSYNGRYTVYTQRGITSDSINPSSVFQDGVTTVKVNENILAPKDPSHSENTGYITSVSTYQLLVEGESPLAISPGSIVEGRPIEVVGHNFAGWGEVIQQNMVRLAQNHAGETPPSSPFLGQTWYDTSSSPAVMKVWDGEAWGIANSVFFAPKTSFKHQQAEATKTWVITHGLEVEPPFVVHASFFVVTDGGVKPIIPQDVSYVSGNQLTVTFSTSYTGFALIRS